ncbi:MAG: hypothetical protein IH626_05530 [Rhodospirillales bacterium]|nr:hypothetical protein [Rhodospirillales bacterium]
MPMTLLNSLKPMPSSAGGAPTNPSLLKPVQDLLDFEPPARVDNALRYDSEEALKKSLAAMGPGAYVIGVRPLDGPVPFYDSPDGGPADRKNIELNHQHLFYLDADGELRDVGFFRPNKKAGEKGGVKLDGEKANRIGDYRFGPVQEGRVINKETLHLKGFGADDYNLFKNNCQDYIDALRQRLIPWPRRRPGV